MHNRRPATAAIAAGRLRNRPKFLLLDRRAHQLIHADFHPEETLSTKEVAAWLGVSVQFLEIGRSRGYGPKFVRITKRLVRYRVDDVIDWLKSRTHACTSEYAKGAL
jgi:predicted DNA-binding transcriptional regulator AlpA